MAVDAAQYVLMQKKFYDEGPDSPEVIVGNYEYHENFPFETQLLYLYGDIRRPVLPDFARARAFDIGCGEGRMIRRMSRLFAGVDGADISEKMVAAARTRCPGSRIHLSTGLDCGPAPSAAYDFAYCTISLQHICSVDVRSAIVGDVARILKDDGCATLQFFFGRYYPFVRTTPPMTNGDFLVDLHHRDRLQAGWFENRHDAVGTNSMCDGTFGASDIPAVLDYFGRWFAETHVWFYDVSIGRADPRAGGRPAVLPETHPNAHGMDNAYFSHMAFFHLRGPKR